MTTLDDGAGLPDESATSDNGRHLPSLSFGEWFVFAVLAGVLAAANIYTTLLIGWGDTGSIIAVLASVVLLGMIGKRRPSVHTLNLGQTMVSAGGSVGFAVASYAAVKIIQPDFDPDPVTLMVLFATMGVLGALIGSTVRKQMVRYFFPSGTACAVIQRTVTQPVVPGQRNRPVFLMKLWGGLASLLTIPTKISIAAHGHGILEPLELWARRNISLGVDPLYYGIGMVVGPRVGVGMVMGSLAVPFLINDGLEGTIHAADAGDWVKWVAIALLTLPTFAAIVYAYLFRTPPVVPPGFTPGRTDYAPPARRTFVYGLVAVLTALGIAVTGDAVFNLPWTVTVITILIAWPLCVVNGRVTGDTDINPVRLVAIVLLSGFFWLFTEPAAITLLGMAVVGGTLAAVAVDMMQDYRTGYLVDANPSHQTTVQFFGAIVGAVVAIPVLSVLVGQLGLGVGSSLPAPGARIWAAMAEAMAGDFELKNALLWTIGWVSVLGSVYAYFTVWPVTARWMPSIFGMGIGMLVGTDASLAIFGGGVIQVVIRWFYVRGRQGEAKEAAGTDAANDTMLAGASVFAAGAVISILVVLVKTVFDALGIQLFTLAH